MKYLSDHPLILAAALGGMIVGAFLASTILARDTGAATVALQGVTSTDLQEFGVTLKQPEGADSPLINRDQATARALELSPAKIGRSTILENLLVHYSAPTGSGLAWAINVDPATVSAFISGPAPSPGWVKQSCSSHPDFHVTFIDAESGAFLFALERGGDVQIVREEDVKPCPSSSPAPLPTVAPASPSQ